jgi:hypothetical protein
MRQKNAEAPMNASNILAEHQRCDSLSMDVLAALLREGIDIEAICRRVKNSTLDPPRLARVIFTSATGFEFAAYKPDMADVGTMVFLIRNHIGDPVDIVAWAPPRPLALWCSRGCMLGAENLFGFRMREALEVHETPLAWLRAACRGVVIIDPQKSADLLRLALPLEAASIEHGQALRQLLEVRPRILVPSSVDRGAA